MKTENINVTISVNEVNMVLNALGNLPYLDVFALIDKIKDQAEQQVAKQNGDSANELLNHAHKAANS